MRRLIVGTAGHIDHGKTSLLEALTGIDCDRWAEEKARGITIDLGFAHLRTDDLQIGFIDVPGHERFLHNALAGLGGIRLLLLVVAADEGVKPQTREHLAIATLLGIENAIVALTKRDLVDDDLATLAQLEVEELLAETPYADAPLLPVSSTTGDGLDTLRDTLLGEARRLADGRDADAIDEPFRLPVDRAFHLKGLGVVVTGTLVSGTVRSGDTLAVHGPSLDEVGRARVRSLHVHGESREAAQAGERTALQLTGVDLAALPRGSQLATPDIFGGGRTLCAHIRLLDEAPEALEGTVPIRVHLYAGEAIGKIRPLGPAIPPGGTGLVEIRLAQPLVGVRGDRFILRRPSPATTLGGGALLDPHWRRRRGALLDSALASITDEDKALRLWVRETGPRGLAAGELSPRLGEPTAAIAAHLDAQVKDAQLLRVEAGNSRRYLAPEILSRIVAHGRTVLADYFAQDRLARGMPKAAFVARLLPKRAHDLAEVYLRWLAAEKVLVTEGSLVNEPGRSAQLTGDESTLARDLLAAIAAEGLTPPSPPELARQLGAKPQILTGVQRYLIERGKLSLLPSGLILATSAVDDLRQTLVDSEWDTFSVSQFKDRFELSRKWAIPMLEHLDSIGATRRLGDARQIIRR